MIVLVLVDENASKSQSSLGWSTQFCQLFHHVQIILGSGPIPGTSWRCMTFTQTHPHLPIQATFNIFIAEALAAGAVGIPTCHVPKCPNNDTALTCLIPPFFSGVLQIVSFCCKVCAVSQIPSIVEISTKIKNYGRILESYPQNERTRSNCKFQKSSPNSTSLVSLKAITWVTSQ